MNSQLHNLANKVWYGPAFRALPLLPLAWIFQLVVSIRRKAYLGGLLARPDLPVPVVVVGNLTAGGAGKTPLVIWLAREIRRRGIRVGIVSRGHGSAHGPEPVLVPVDGDAARFGDEPVLLAQLSGCPVVICPDRPAGVLRLAEEHVALVLADDGLQHYRLQRQFEIVVVDGQRGFGNGFLLPAGPLREPVSRAAEADALVYNGGLSAAANAYRFELVPDSAVSLDGKSIRALGAFAGQRVWAVAGIGNPERFFTMLRSAGLELDEVALPDHGTMEPEKLLRRRVQPVLMTAKDAVKYRDQHSDQLWYVPVNLSIDSTMGMELCDRLLRSCGLMTDAASPDNGEHIQCRQ